MTIAFPFTPVLDNFNRANTGPPPSANWGSDIHGHGDPGLRVVSNALAGPSGADGGSWWSAKTFRDDCEAYATVVTPGFFELWVRGTALGTSSGTAYALEWRGDDHTLTLVRWGPGFSGYYASTGAGTVVVNLVAGDKIGVRMQGSTITGWVKQGAGAWTKMLETDSFRWTTGGQIGAYIYGATPGALDDFGGGSIPAEVSPSGVIFPTSTQRHALTRGTAGGPKGALTVSGVMTKATPKAATASVALLGTLALATGTAPLITPQADFPVMEEEQVAVLPWPDGQRVLQQPGSEGLAIPASCGWHGSAFDPERGAFGIVASDGPLADLVGERLKVTRRDVSPARTVWVYVHADSETLTEELSLSRRAFMALGDLALDSVQVSVDTVSAAVIT